jgi:hypothetical protein
MFNIDGTAGVIAAALVFLPTVGIIDEVAHNAASWRAARPQSACVMIQVVLNVLGVLLYFLIAHPRVSRLSRQNR